MILRVRHYWDRISEKEYSDEVESIKFVKHQSHDTQHRNRLGLRWILLALCNKGDPDEAAENPGDLQVVFQRIFADSDFMLMYDQNQSILWKHKEITTEALKELHGKHTECKTKLSQSFIEYNTGMQEAK